MSKVKLKCVICNYEFEVWKCNIDKRKTCGKKECMTSYMSKIKKGIPSNKKGKTFEEIYGKENAKKIRRKQRKSFFSQYKKENHYNYGKKLSNETCDKKSKEIKKAYAEGRMEHMKDNWKEASKRWQGEGNPRWREIGDIKYDTQGYAILKTENGWQERARNIAEKKLGRKLKKEEIIHHINYIKNDDRIENLYLFKNGKEHRIYHLADTLHKKIKIKYNLISNL